MNNKDKIGCLALPAIFLVGGLIGALIDGDFGGVIACGIACGIFLFMGIAFVCGSEEESTGSYENKAEQNNNVLSDSQKEELKSLIDTFEAYMSKPFPDRHLFPYSAFFDDFWRVIGKIEGYDFECGWEKGRQLEDKIKAHNKALAKRSRQKKSSQSISQEEFADKIIQDLHKKRERQRNADLTIKGNYSNFQNDRLRSLKDSFESFISKPFPDKHLNPNDSFFDDCYTTIAKIKGYDFRCGREKENQLLDKIRIHNDIIANRSKQNRDELIHGKIGQQRIADLAIEGNEDFIGTHLNDSVFNSICGFSLNDEQRKAILCDSKYNLVIADEKSGKTLTILGKIKYLLENNLAKEDEILVLSYLDDSVDELNRRIPEISPNLKAKTFHSFGFDILSEHIGEKKAVDDQLLAHIKAFFDKNYDKSSELRDNVEKYFSLSPRYPYFMRDFVNDISPDSVDNLIEDFRSTDFNVLNEALKKSQGSSKRLLTIKKESVKSMEELAIANYLFVNGIKYEYEKPYEINTATVDKRQYCPDFYLPRYKIYIEHYGTNQAGKTPQYSADEEQKYKESMEWKRMTHKQYKTTCIETYSSEFADGTIFDHLKEKLAKYEVKFKERWTQNYKEEVKNALMNLYDGRDLSKLMYILEDALSIYKSGCVYLRWKSRVDAQEQERIGSFLKILKEIKDYYDKALKRNKKVDFDDMILQATKYLPKFKDRYRYKYILIDEFHDTPPIIFNFLEQLVEHGNSKLMAVGDNRQYKDRFTSSDISIIWDLKEKSFPKAEINRISKKTLENTGE